MARTVGIGKQNFEKMIVNHNFYVDKTLFIKEKENENLKFLTFLKCHADEDELDRQFLRLHKVCRL